MGQLGHLWGGEALMGQGGTYGAGALMGQPVTHICPPPPQLMVSGAVLGAMAQRPSVGRVSGGQGGTWGGEGDTCGAEAGGHGGGG